MTTRPIRGWMLLLMSVALSASAAEPVPARVHQESQHFTIDSNLPAGFPEAILNLCETDLAGYKDLFGLDVIPPGDTQRIHVFADFEPNSGALYVVLKSPLEIHLLVGSDRNLNPPGRGGPHNVFGFAHEMGHLVMMFDDPQFGQGFATYFGSEVVDYLQPRLGDKAWPRPYDYVAEEGTPRLKGRSGNTDPGSESAAADLLYEIALQHGGKVIGEAVKQLAASSDFTIEHESGFDYKAYKVESFCRVLVELTGDQSIETLFADRGFGPQAELEQERIPVATPAPPPPAAGQSAPATTGKLESAHFVIKSHLPQPFPQAILDLCEASLDGYRELFGLDLSPKAGERKLRIFADRDASVQSGLWVRPERVPAEIHFMFAEDRQLNPPGQGGAHHVFGFAHEFGHLAVMFDDPQFGQGFADYLGSEVVDYLQPRLGEKAWPRPYDYVTLDGIARLKTWQSEATPDRENAVAVVLYEITQKHGRKVIGKAVARLAASAKPVVARGDFGEDHLAYRVADFRRALVEVTGDKSIETLFAQRIPPAPRVTNITSQELWACRSEEERTKLMEERWGGDAAGGGGLLDGKEVSGLLTGFPPSEKGACGITNGLNMELLGGAWQYCYFQPSSGRSYLIGRFRVLPAGTIVQDDAIDAEGKPLHLNPNAPPAVPAKDMATTESAHFALETNAPGAPVQTVLSVSEAALDAYQTLFGLDLRPNKAAKKIQLSLLSFEDPHYVGLIARPEPVPVVSVTAQTPDEAGSALSQYLLVRGLGGLAASFDDDNFQDGFTEYLAAEAMSYVQQCLGDGAWPGAGERGVMRRVAISRAKFLATKSGGDGTGKDAAALLARIAQQHGTAAIGAAIRELQQSAPSIPPPPGVARRYHVDDLRRALIELTGDTGITGQFDEAGF